VAAKHGDLYMVIDLEKRPICVNRPTKETYT